MKKIAVVILFALLLLCAGGVFAQSNRTPAETNKKANQRPPETPKSEASKTDPAPEEIPADAIIDDTEAINVATELVTIPVRVTDRKGRFVADLTKENFTIFEDDAPQEIAFFSNEQQPFTVALVLDMSYSATFKINEIHAAAIAFIDQLRPNDKVMVVSFDEEVHVLTEPTTDRQAIYRAIKQTRVASGTSLYEAVDLIVNKKFRKLGGRKAIVLFTDGVDTTSKTAWYLSNLRDVEEIDTLVYPIQYDTFNDVQAIKNNPVMIPPTIPGPIPPTTKSPLPFPLPTGGIGMPSSQGTTAEDYRKAGEYLEEMAKRTGGRIYQANTTSNLAYAFKNIASELREFYSLGYYPPEDAKVGKKRRIKVKIDQKGLSVKARDGYTVGKKAEK